MTLHIVGISSSLRPGSISQNMVEQLLSVCRQQGAQTDLIDLREYPQLPFCDGRPSDQYGPTVSQLQQKIQQADALIVGTPEYHGGYSGALKNFLDLNDIDVFRGKLVGLVGSAGGCLGAEAALNQLRVVFKNLETLCFPTQTTAGPADADEQKRIVNPKIIQRLNQMGQDFITLAQKLSGQPVGPLSS